MKQYLVTVKLPKNPMHNPRNKVTGVCPVNDKQTCTDVTGEHHTALYNAPEHMNILDVRAYWADHYHVTRVEEV